MKGFKKWITSPIATIVLFVTAAGLLLFSTIGGARAAFLAISETYSGQVEMYDIGVSLMEKSAHDEEAEIVAYRNYEKNSQDEWRETPGKVGKLLENLLASNEEFVPGKTYSEEISVKNTGTINEWVRVTIYKYWLDPNGNKVVPYNKEWDAEIKNGTRALPEGMIMADEGNLATYGLSPELIKITYANEDEGNGQGDWILDKEASTETEERTVYYYNKLLKAGEDTTKTPLTSALTIDKSVADKVKQTPEDDGKTIVTTFVYDGWQFCVEADVDAVQERNAVEAIKSAWGRDVSFRENGTMVLE